MNSFKNLKFRSVSHNKIECAVQLLKKLGYEEVHSDFSVYDAVSHNGICAWDDGEITEGWLDDDNFEQVTLEELKEMVGEGKEVLWLNIETLEERVITDGKKFYSDVWVKVPDGATFATGGKDNFVFRKDGWYYEDSEWVGTELTFDKVGNYKQLKLFWVKGDVKGGSLSNNFKVAWEQVFGEKFVDSVIKAVKQNKAIVSKSVKQNKDNVMENDTFTLERLLGCEVSLYGEIGYICNTYNYHEGVVHLTIDGCVISSKPSCLTFFTEGGDELTFDEYLEMYYPCD